MVEFGSSNNQLVHWPWSFTAYSVTASLEKVKMLVLFGCEICVTGFRYFLNSRPNIFASYEINTNFKGNESYRLWSEVMWFNHNSLCIWWYFFVIVIDLFFLRKMKLTEMTKKKSKTEKWERWSCVGPFWSLFIDFRCICLIEP